MDDRETWQRIADTITYWMDAGELTQATLAEAIHLSPFQLSRRLSGVYQWRPNELERVAMYLKIPVADLFDGTVRDEV